MNSEQIINVNDLHVNFETYSGSAKVLNGVDLTINEGETVALVGETGCGKSVTAKTILGLLQQPPASIPRGDVYFKGSDILSMSEKELHNLRGREMGLIMQDPMTSLNPVFTVGEQMMDVLKWQGKQRFNPIDWAKYKIHGESDLREQALDMLREVQIAAPERVFSSYPAELSGGMCQRILIAMSLLSEPDFLIADEPSTALDVTTEAKILDLIDDLVQKKGTSVLYITHDLGVAKKISDRINVMYAGEIVEEASKQELFENPKHPYTRGLLESIPQLSIEMGSGIDGELPDYTDPPQNCRFAPRCQYAEESCQENYPYRRETTDGHSVSCHFYSGPPISSCDREEAEDVDIGTAPWEVGPKTSPQEMNSENLDK